MDSYVFDFEKSPTFYKAWNKEFDVETLDGDTFNIILVDEICDDNIEDCLENNRLKYSSEHYLLMPCNLIYDEIDFETVNIKLADDVTFNIDEDTNFELKGAFVTNDSGYVMGYSINQRSISVYNQVIFEKDLVFWSVVDGDTHV